jgi:NitT/TauT family transport system substrate-binding protein
MNKRVFVRAAAALALAAAFASPALAQNTPIKFQLDWRFEGPAALFLTPSSTVRRVVNMTALAVADANSTR